VLIALSEELLSSTTAEAETDAEAQFWFDIADR
jgi:hypothetical protein